MTSTIHIGIDPGASGAIAVLGPETALTVHDMPVMGPRAQVNAAALADLLREATLGRPCHVWVEAAHAMPRQGVVSTFAFGRSLGTIEGVVAALCLPLTLVSSASWKRALGVARDKRAAIARAVQLRPDAASLLTRARDHGRAEAILIALYGSRS
jgi:crossover junction endodeoxyribonuclease RuvC